MPFTVEKSTQQSESSKIYKPVNNTGSCFGYQLFVMCHFFVSCAGALHNMFGGGGGGVATLQKSGALQKKVMHYKKLVPKTRKLVPETTNKNHCYCRPQNLSLVPRQIFSNFFTAGRHNPGRCLHPLCWHLFIFIAGNGKRNNALLPIISFLCPTRYFHFLMRHTEHGPYPYSSRPGVLCPTLVLMNPT